MSFFGSSHHAWRYRRSDLIVTYNDGGIGKEGADAWFSKALEIAQQQR